MVKTVTPVVQRALILSANNDQAGSIRNSLKTFDYGAIDTIENGLEALQKLATTSYEIIVCNNKLKFISGWNLIKEIKTSDKIPNMPVILMGDLPGPAPDDELKAYGLVQFMKAPPSASDLKMMINSTLQLFKTSGTTENKFTKAKAALIAKESDQALELYSELQGLTKKGLRSSLGLAEAYIQKGNTTAAEKVLADAGHLNASNSATALIRIKIFISQKQFSEAQTAGLSLLQPQVQSPFVHSRILGLYTEQKVLEEAEHVCRDAIQKNFRLPEFHNGLVRIFFQKSQIRECLDVIHESIEIFGPNAEILNIKGASLRKLNMLDHALDAYAEALKLSPMDARVYYNMAVCCVAKKSISEAKNHLEMCLKIKPDFPNAQAKLDEVQKFLSAAA